ncbi:hypothetical protein SAMN05421770_104275 [Granulicella rosea]|uniref:Uncharacterized protein n=1 Tax=Granulicella rosea TaxID=474952 RepID=A0A239K3F7_9BACT|nr:hypothetical protein [Granulicella rosea]SNT12645.1 hypothetical protein SAMN05421770_104275 [Granulicella rosea]
MNTRYKYQAMALTLAAVCMPAFAQTPAKSAPADKPFKFETLSDGQPNVQGTWTAVYYGMGCLTNPTNGDVNCVPPPGPRPAAGTANAGGPPSVDPNTGKAPGQRGNGNPPTIVHAQPDGPRGGGRQRAAGGQGAAGAPAVAYTDNAAPTTAPARAPRVARNAPSRIIDTPNYDIPYTPEALAHQQDLFAHYYEFTRYGDIDPQQRCWPLGAVRQFTWHDVKIQQYPGYVILLFAGAEVYRIIYLDNRPHIGNGLKLWMGDSRGHWEGNTLVVDTTSNNAKGRLSRAGDFSSDKVHYTERFKFTGRDTLRYEATFDDPSVYTRPWTFAVDEKRGYFGGDGGVPNEDITPESQAKFELWEEACQEGLIPGGNDVPNLPLIPAEFNAK